MTNSTLTLRAPFAVRLRACAAPLLLGCLVLPALAADAATAMALAEEAVTLSPFEVTASSDMGYQATETLSGSRLKTDLKDVATQVTVMTPEFLQDLAITNLDDAMNYSLNAENNDDAMNILLPGGAGIEATSRPFGGSNRVRGLTPPNRAHDFFDTFISIDSYNTERFTFSSGPNSILFGNSSPSGTIDTTLKRAQLTRPKYEIGYRIDDNGSHRGTTDLNQPIVKHRLGLRLAGLSDRNHHWRAPGFANEDRLYGNLAFQPFKQVTLRAYHETISNSRNPVRNTLLQDHVTPWVLAGKTVFDNGGTAALTAKAATTTPFALRDNTPFYVLGATGVLGPVGVWGNTAVTRGFDTMTGAAGNPLDNYEHSIIDPQLYRFDRNFSGNANRSTINAWSRGLVLEVNPLKKFFVEAAINQERFKQKGVDYFNNQAAELDVDANRFLNDRLTPNPNFGRYYFDDNGGALVNARNYGSKEQKRFSFSYELDFEERPGWVKWLGRHRFAALFDRLTSVTAGEESPARIVGDYSFTNTTANSRLINFRYYIDPEHQTISLPFDPLADGIIALPGAVDANGKQVNIASWDPSITSSQITLNDVLRNLASSRSLVLQSFLLKNRIAFSYGERTDNVEVQQAPTLDPSPDFYALAQGSIPWETQKSGAPRTRLKSVVAHPLKWLSVSYAESNSQRVEASGRRNYDGSLALTGAGAGKEYGITLRWGDRLSLRLDQYENSSVGNLASGRALTPTATFAGRGNNVRREVANLERSAELYESADRGDQSGRTFTPSAKYAAFQEALVQLLPTGANAGNSVQQVYDILSDRVAKGYELTLVGNPTSNWRIAVTAAKNQTIESNIGPEFFDFIKERLPVWANYLNRQFLPNAQGATIGQVLNASIQGFNYVRLTEGHLNALERKYRVTATTRYGFDHGKLKGAFVGANYTWRSPAASGYNKKTITDNPFVVPGLTTSTLQVDDVDNPIYGRALTSIDAFLGYSRRLFKNHAIMWRVQLNVRNLLDNDYLLLQQASITGITGGGAIYTSQQPRSFILTNTFSF